jgi:hypothetical protein
MNDFVHEGNNNNNNSNRNLFADFSDVAQRLGVYTAQDYLASWSTSSSGAYLH